MKKEEITNKVLQCVMRRLRKAFNVEPQIIEPPHVDPQPEPIPTPEPAPLQSKHRHFSLPVKYNVSRNSRITLRVKALFGSRTWVAVSHRDVQKGKGEVLFTNLGIDMNVKPGEYALEGIIEGKVVLKRNITITKDDTESFLDSGVAGFTPYDTDLVPLAFWDFGKHGNVNQPSDLQHEFHYGMFWGKNNPNNPKANPAEWQNYTPFDSNNYHFEEDHLDIILRQQGIKPRFNSLTSGVLRSKDSFEPTKDYELLMQLKVKLPKGKGLWPAWWMYPSKTYQKRSELDMFEVVNTKTACVGDYEPIIWHSNFHSHAAPPHTQYPMMHFEEKPLSSGEWATFTAIWSLTECKIFLNGNLRRVIDIDYKDPMGWGRAGAGQMIVNLAAGGGWPGPADDASAYPAKMSIAYMGVWKLPTS